MRMNAASILLAAAANTIQGTLAGRTADGSDVVVVDTTPRPSEFVRIMDDFANYNPVSNLVRMFRDAGPVRRRKPDGPKRRSVADVKTAQRRARRITRLHAK